MVEVRYHVTVWNWFYPVFIAVIKNMAEEVKLFSLSSYFTLLLTNNVLLTAFQSRAYVYSWSEVHYLLHGAESFLRS